MKKAEGTIGGVVMITLLFLGGAMIIGSLVSQFATQYGRADLPEFDDFEGEFELAKGDAYDIIDTQNANNITQEPDEKFEDSTFRRAMVTINSFKNSLKRATSAFERTLDNINVFKFDKTVTLTLFILLGVGISLLIVKAIWRYDKV